MFSGLFFFIAHAPWRLVKQSPEPGFGLQSQTDHIPLGAGPGRMTNKYAQLLHPQVTMPGFKVSQA